VGITVPAKTPLPTFDQLNAERVRIVHMPDVRERLNAMALTVVGSVRAIFKAEFARWGKAVRDSGAKIN
jgi:hypothetical protein